MSTISDLYPLDDIEGATISDVEFTSGDNDHVTFQLTLDNGLVLDGKVGVRELRRSDIDLPDDVLVDGLPLSEW